MDTIVTSGLIYALPRTISRKRNKWAFASNCQGWTSLVEVSMSMNYFILWTTGFWLKVVFNLENSWIECISYLLDLSNFPVMHIWFQNAHCFWLGLYSTFIFSIKTFSVVKNRWNKFLIFMSNFWSRLQSIFCSIYLDVCWSNLNH